MEETSPGLNPDKIPLDLRLADPAEIALEITAPETTWATGQTRAVPVILVDRTLAIDRETSLEIAPMEIALETTWATGQTRAVPVILVDRILAIDRETDLVVDRETATIGRADVP